MNRLLRSEQLTKALPPAKTTSAGSSSVCRVRTTTPVLRSTMLTSSLTRFTTQASLLERARTVTGSTPTVIERSCSSP